MASNLDRKKFSCPILTIVTLSLSFALTNGEVALAQKNWNQILLLPDSVTPFSLDEFYRIILEFHPSVRHARLLNESARQELRLARGNFDPKATVSLEKKEFEDKTYYNKVDAYLSFPSWFPMNPAIGMQNHTGQLLNNEETIPGGQQVFAGVNLPIGRGLFTDERRAMVKQAALLTTMAEADQIKQINKILLQAAKDYWQWYYSYYNFLLMDKGSAIAEEIFKRVKQNLQHGEASKMDSLQAKIILQSRLLDRTEAQLGLQYSSLLLSNYLWDSANQPLQLSPRVAPVMTAQDKNKLDKVTILSLVDQARQNHPELIKYKTKISQVQIERKLAKEFLKPKIDLNYYALSQPAAPKGVDLTRDYKMGVDFSMPLFLRKERSKLALTELKLTTTQFEQQQAQREIINEINISYNQLISLMSMIAMQSEIVNMYEQLLDAEMMNLKNGESDVFKIGLQQEKLIHVQNKLIKLKADFEKTKASVYWAAGVRNLNFQ